MREIFLRGILFREKRTDKPKLFKSKTVNSAEIKNLLKLIAENPDLPIIPIVDSEIVGDGYGYGLGSWGSARIDEIILTSAYGILFKGDDDIFDTLEKCLTDEEFEKLPETEKQCRPYYDALPWEKAIIIYINSINPNC